jgi:agmatinase
MPNFFPDAPSSLDKAKIVMVPVPFDGTSTWRKGANKGPDAILEASEHLEGYDIETGTEVYRQRIFTDDPVEGTQDPQAMVEAVSARVTSYLQQDKFTVVIGGEHSVSIGAVQAHKQWFPDMTVLQLDAHADLRETYHGSSFNHACVMARIRSLCPIVQVGIRSMDIRESKAVDPERVFFAQDIVASEAWMAKVIEQLSCHVYITIDLDVFDPSDMPSTGTPEPGGLQWYPVLQLLRSVCQYRTLVGFDVVELCPVPVNKAPDFLAAKLIYKLLSYRFK